MTRLFRTPIAVAALIALSACGVFKGGHKKTPTLGERIPILVSESPAEPDRSLADVEVLLPEPAVNEAWTQPGGNASKSLGHVALGASPSPLWHASIAGSSPRKRLAAAPVVSGGKLFAMDVDGAVNAFSADTGAKLWRVEIATGKRYRGARFGGGVSVESGRVYASDGLGNVAALDAGDGKVIWRVKPGGPLRGAPTVANGAVYVLSQDNQLFALAETDGQVEWTGSASLETQGVFGVAAPAAARGTIIAGFSSGELNAYRYENGRVLWQDTLSRTSISTSVSSLADIDAAPVIDQNRVYAVGQGGRMVALELTTGGRVWEQNFAGISTPWIAGEWLFVVTDDARLVCLSRANGKVRWISDLGAYRNRKKRKGDVLWVGPILAGGRLIVANSRGQIVEVSPQTGQKGAVIARLAPISLAPIVANNTLYVLDDKGRISAFR